MTKAGKENLSIGVLIVMGAVTLGYETSPGVGFAAFCLAAALARFQSLTPTSKGDG